MAQSQQASMASAALRHPIRVRLLEALHLRREISATMFVNEAMGKDLKLLKGSDHQQQVSDVSYHLVALEKMNCVCRTRKVKRRGGNEVFYRSKAVAYFSDEEWAKLPFDERKEISRVVAQSFIVQIEGALMAETFDSRLDRWLLWERMELDEQGWRELSDSTRAFYDDVEEIRNAAKGRLEDADESAAPIRTTFGVASFESPPVPEPAVLDPDDNAPDDQE